MSVYHQRLHFTGWSVSHDRETFLLYGLRVTRELASKLVLFFMPLFLFKVGESLPLLSPLLNSFQQGMLVIAAYHLINRVASIFCLIPIGKMIKRIGPQRSFVISQVSYVLYFSILYYCEQWPWLLILVALLEVVQVFFWNSYYVVMTEQITKKSMGSNMGAVSFLLNLAAMASPVIGGVVITYFGYPILFLLGLCTMLAGTIFAVLMAPTHITDQVSWKEFFTWLREPGYRKLAVSYAGRYMNDSVLVMWPLYVFFLLGTVDRVGFLYGLSLFCAMLIVFATGSFIDTHRRARKPFFFSGGLLTILWVLRTQTVHFWSIAFIDIIDRLTSNFHWLFFDTFFMRRGKGSQALSFFVYRELINSLVAVMFWLLFAMLFLLTTNSWQMLFGLAAVGVMLSLLVKDHKDPLNEQTKTNQLV